MNEAPYLQELRRNVAALGRAHTRGQLLGGLAKGLLAGLLCACAAVIASRLQWLPGSSLQVAAACAVTGALGGGAIAWARLPDSMALVIRADLALSLRQQLSTAWELLLRDPHGDDAARMAAQVSRLRVGPRLATIWPVTLPAAARWLPAAAAAVLFSAWVELPEASPQSVALEVRTPATEDGTRGARPQRLPGAPGSSPRARPTSAPATQNLDALAQQLSAGRMGPREALMRLADTTGGNDAGRRAALSQGDSVDVGPSGAGAGASRQARALSRLMSIASAQQLDARSLADAAADAGALQALGIDASALEEALARHAAGDSSALRQLLREAGERLRQSREASLLAGSAERARAGSASRRERRAERDSGTSQSGTNSPSSRARGGEPGDDMDLVDAGSFEDGEGASAASSALDDGAPGGRGGGAAGAGSNSGGDESRQAGNRTGTTVVLRAYAAPGDGVVFRSRGLAIPRQNASTLDAVQSGAAPRYQTQAERAQATQSMGPAERALVRRYFLALEQTLDNTGDPAR